MSTDVKYIIIVTLFWAVAAAVSGVIIYQTVRLIARQVKLYYSITLVEFKTPKYQYYVCALLLGFLLFYSIAQMCDPAALEVARYEAIFGEGQWRANVALGAATLILFSLLVFSITLAACRTGVVDKGVYTNFERLDWYNVHDYIIDESNGVVILSSSKRTFSTLEGTTPPFKVAHDDVFKLQFILNKNKNKFSGF